MTGMQAIKPPDGHPPRDAVMHPPTRAFWRQVAIEDLQVAGGLDGRIQWQDYILPFPQSRAGSQVLSQGLASHGEAGAVHQVVLVQVLEDGGGATHLRASRQYRVLLAIQEPVACLTSVHRSRCTGSPPSRLAILPGH